jgi:hypothetical protein
MPWAAYAAVVGASEGRLDALQITAESRLRAYLSAASALENPAVAEVFRQSQIDLRRVLALLALGEAGADTRAADEIVPLAAFHLQETSPVLRARAAGLLRATLERTDVTTYLTDLPDTVLEYLRTNFCDGQPAREAAGHWIEAELSRRKNAYRLEALLKPPPLPRSATPQRVEHPVTQAEAALSAPPPAAVEPVIAPVRLPRRRVPPRPAVPAPPPPQAEAADTPEQDPLTPLLGELALPTSAPKKSDSATWLWVAIILILLVMVAIVIGVVVYLQSLQPAPALSHLAAVLLSLTR